jgi:2'-5' RNA ligase
MDTLRSFIAIELPPELKSELQSIQTSLQKGQVNYVKWVDTHNIHLTLKFLGDIERAQIDPIVSAIETSTGNSRPFSLSLQDVGAFPSLDRPNIVWAGLQGDLKTLSVWQITIEQNLKPLGFTPESRPFSPHLTLGRVRENATLLEKQSLGRQLAAIHLKSGSPMIVSSLNLVHSQLTPKGPIYTILRSIKLPTS